MGTQKNSLNEMVFLSTQNICYNDNYNLLVSGSKQNATCLCYVAPILINILKETSYAVFTFCRSSLFLKDPFSILFTCDHYI